MRRALCLLAVVISAASCTRQRITGKEAIDTIRKFDEGWEKKNRKAVDAVLSPSYIYFTQSGNLFSRDSVVATAGQNSYILENMRRSEFQVTVTGNTAVVSTRWKGKGIYRGEAFDEDQRCSIVLIKTGDSVKILSEHCTPIRIKTLFH